MCDFFKKILKHVDEFTFFLFYKLNLDKPSIIQKYCCYKVLNQFIIFTVFYVKLGSKSNGSVPFEILNF